MEQSGDSKILPEALLAPVDISKTVWRVRWGITKYGAHLYSSEWGFKMNVNGAKRKPRLLQHM